MGDFGIARVLDSTNAKAQTSVGTPQYMAPELYKGETYGLAADMWSLGCVLFECMVLKPPFSGTNILAVTRAVVDATPEPLPSRYSHDVRDLCTSLLSKKPDKRPTSAQILRTPVLVCVRNEVERLWNEQHGDPKVAVSSAQGSSPRSLGPRQTASQGKRPPWQRAEGGGVCKLCAVM